MKTTKQVLTLREVFQKLHCKTFKTDYRVKEFFIYQWYPQNDIFIKIILDFKVLRDYTSINVSYLFKISEIELYFSDLDKLGYELDNAYSEFQDLISSHTEQLQ